jgi:hypothetical protein
VASKKKRQDPCGSGRRAPPDGCPPSAVLIGGLSEEHRTHAARAQATDQPETARKTGSELGVNVLEKEAAVISPQLSVSKSGPDFRLSLKTDY